MPVTANHFKYALATNSTSTSFTAQNASTTEPSGAGVFDLFSVANGVGGAPSIPEWLQLMPFGTDANDETFDMRLWGYTPTEPTASLSRIYIPQLLVDVSVTLCAATLTPHAADTFLSDTLTVNDGAADNGQWLSLIAPAEDLAASVLVNTRGCRYIKFDWDLTGAAAMNCLWRALDTIPTA